MSNHYKAKFTLSDASNLDSLDLPGLVAKRKEKKYLNGSQSLEPKGSVTKNATMKQSGNDR